MILTGRRRRGEGWINGQGRRTQAKDRWVMGMWMGWGNRSGLQEGSHSSGPSALLAALVALARPPAQASCGLVNLSWVLQPTTLPPTRLVSPASSLDAGAMSPAGRVLQWCRTCLASRKPDCCVDGRATNRPPSKRSRVWEEGDNRGRAGRGNAQSLVEEMKKKKKTLTSWRRGRGTGSRSAAETDGSDTDLPVSLGRPDVDGIQWRGR